MAYVLISAIVAAAAVGGVRSVTESPAPSSAPTPIAAAPEALAPAAEAAEAPAGDAIEGEVLEVVDVPSYSYLRIGAKGTEGTWVAVPTAGLSVGEHARVRDAMKMTDFKSAALKRTFPVIYFGTIDDRAPARGGAAALPPGHPRLDSIGGASGADPHASGAADGADPHAATADPHANAATGGAQVKPVERAAGPGGRTVAEAIGQRTQLAGKLVRIHGTVVKSTPGIMGRTYLHLRDGSGDPAAGTGDISVTTEATPAVGETILVEGTLALDRDIGSGYKFPTIVEDAKVLTAP
jgi:hypothetical protein